ncbi:hypothetical protein ZRA01_18980 [Zoogloea ramigera]|uniref:Uncharacterized protein n=1 Tax=Zoogloea ramigera TaxID=350 RepID=A0A4Y4CSC0_ZOORA|nr:hypothetical protein [Zoogloea ramigera]GEC95825.1 hypothetical protein ZRA01_18980 [Zoogloea ramigera]
MCKVKIILSRFAEAADFIRAQCKNDQVLVVSSIVPASGFDSEVVRLERTFCPSHSTQLIRHTPAS